LHPHYKWAAFFRGNGRLFFRGNGRHFFVASIKNFFSKNRGIFYCTLGRHQNKGQKLLEKIVVDKGSCMVYGPNMHRTRAMTLSAASR